MQDSEFTEPSTFTVAEELAGTRLDSLITKEFSDLSRSRAAKFISEKLVTINEKFVKPSYVVAEGDLVTINWPQPTQVDLSPWDYPLDIAFEDDDLIVVNKPAGMVVHPSAGHESKTLVNALISHCKQLSMGFAEHRPGIVHRLDKDTSGLLVVAKNDKAHAHLSEQFQGRTVLRTYIALVHGVMREEECRVENSLARHPTERKKFASLKEGDSRTGKVAITNISQLQDVNGEISLIRCKLKTGRTHQIRIHTSEMLHPILGDTLYGSKRRDLHVRSDKLKRLIKNMNRIALHACEIGFTHPTTGEHLSFFSEWPEDLINIKEQLKLGSLKTCLS